MGKGDKKTRRGKIVIGSHGIRRPHRRVKKVVVKPKPEPKPKKKVEEPLVIPVAMPELETAPILTVEETPVKKPVRKASPKKAAEKAESSETDEPKPKTPKTKKKAAESNEGQEEPKEN